MLGGCRSAKPYPQATVWARRALVPKAAPRQMNYTCFNYIKCVSMPYSRRKNGGKKAITKIPTSETRQRPPVFLHNANAHRHIYCRGLRQHSNAPRGTWFHGPMQRGHPRPQHRREFRAHAKKKSQKGYPGSETRWCVFSAISPKHPGKN